MLKTSLIKRLEKFLKENEMLGNPATSEQIAKAEKELNIKLPEEYVDFITRFGATYAGVDIYAFEEPENIVRLTLQAREAYKNDGRQEEAMRSVVISDDGAGNPILINGVGEVVVFYHDCDERELLASSLNQLIENNFEEW